MARRSTLETLRSLGSAVQNLERATDPVEEDTVAALRRILENRIAALEILEVVTFEAGATANPGPD